MPPSVFGESVFGTNTSLIYFSLFFFFFGFCLGVVGFFFFFSGRGAPPAGLRGEGGFVSRLGVGGGDGE